jgi:hypothetical protein
LDPLFCDDRKVKGMSLIRLAPKQAPVFLASKWLHLDLLVESLDSLFDSMPSFFHFSTLGVQLRGANAIQRGDFAHCWQTYINDLKNGKIPQDPSLRFYCTSVLTTTLDAVRALDIADDKEIIIPYEPVVQMQLHRFSYSSLDSKFHSMAFGQNSISWGVRLSYPQLFQYPQTRQVEEALDETRFANATLFLACRQWMREHTRPTPFEFQGVRTNVPMRIGKECLTWINNHPELALRGLSVMVPRTGK